MQLIVSIKAGPKNVGVQYKCATIISSSAHD